MIDKMEDSRTKVVVVTSILVSGCLRKWEENLPKHDMIELKRLPETRVHASCNELSISCCAQVQVGHIIILSQYCQHTRMLCRIPTRALA